MNAPARVRLLIVDDQPIIRRGLALMLAAESDVDVVGQASDGAEAIALAAELAPDIVLMDLQMPRTSGVVATREITAARPATRVVVLTTFDDDELVFEAIRAGAQAYLLKDASESEVLATIRAVHAGESRLSPRIARKVIEQFRSFTPPPPPVHQRDDDGDEALSSKEERILALLAEGLANKQIAATVYLAEGTVKNYVSRIMEKLHARSRVELAVRAAARRR
ncbi:MAG: response regulator transcription factor [Burkholderiales bacterium]|nr:response regulator transcription factor [Pseudomonadota bacterium]MCC7066858.1 response regulator transcription factor [Burkholderiales bacterium]